MVSSTTKKVTYTCNGTGPYPITFTTSLDVDGNCENLEAIITDSDGVETTLTMDSGDLTATLLNCYTADSYDNTNTITIYRKMPYTQTTDLIRGGSLSLEALEDMFDEIYMHLQELDEKNDRAMQTAIADSDVDQTIPNEADRAGKFCAWNDDGEVIAADNVDTNVPVTAAMQTVLDDETIAAARTTLEVYSKSENEPDEIIAAGSEALKCVIVEIGTWNMDAIESVAVEHGLSDPKKIRSISAIVRTDDDTEYFPLVVLDASGANVGGGFTLSAGTMAEVVLTRVTGGNYDSSDYDATSYNRGWITIWYEG